jgi:hypothetical protein
METLIEPEVENKITPLDALEAEMTKYAPVQCPLVHRFTPGLYIREIFIPKDTLLTSVEHLTMHPFVISKGDISVWVPGGEIQRLTAPYTGITSPKTRRLLYAHEDTVWTTFHVTDLTDPDEIIKSITNTSPNPLLQDVPDHIGNQWRKNWQPSLEEGE